MSVLFNEILMMLIPAATVWQFINQAIKSFLFQITNFMSFLRCFISLVLFTMANKEFWGLNLVKYQFFFFLSFHIANKRHHVFVKIERQGNFKLPPQRLMQF